MVFIRKFLVALLLLLILRSASQNCATAPAFDLKVVEDFVAISPDTNFSHIAILAEASVVDDERLETLKAGSIRLTRSTRKTSSILSFK